MLFYQIGLKLLFSAGYIHRDLSTGNLIYCEDGSCKISDLEYAKPCGLVQELGIENEGGVDKGGKTVRRHFCSLSRFHADILLGNSRLYGHRNTSWARCDHSNPL